MNYKKLLFKIKFNQKDRIKGLKLPKRLSSDLAYLCGILAGDGSIYKREKKHDYILKCVGNPKDEQKLYFDIIGPCFKRVFGFLPNIRLHDQDTTFGFVVHSKSLFEYLTKVIGLPSGKKYNSLKILNKFKEEKELLINFIRGVIDTDGSISFKKKYKDKPYYPVISVSSKSRRFIKDISDQLKMWDFKVVEFYDYKVIDKRINRGFTIINYINLNGKENLKRWINLINFQSPKHLEKIEKYWEEK